MACIWIFRDMRRRDLTSSRYILRSVTLQVPGTRLDSQLQSIFKTIRETTGRLGAEGLQFCKVTRPAILFTDFRLNSTFVVVQQDCQYASSEGWLKAGRVQQPTPAERNYSTLGGEALARRKHAWTPQTSPLSRTTVR